MEMETVGGLIFAGQSLQAKKMPPAVSGRFFPEASGLAVL
jgi:hypothetical protein